jgi:hypothetical protein
MSALLRLQHAFQAFVLDTDPQAETEIVSTPALSATARLEIYSDAYRLRLIEALASNYPRLKQTIGEEQFNELALRYIAVQRSHHPSIRWYGDRLAAFIAMHRPDEPWLSDLAVWEWAIATAFDAPDADTVDASALASIQAEQWSELRLEFHPSLQRVDVRSNAIALFKACTEEQTAPSPGTDSPTAWLVWRQDLRTRYRSLQDDEAAILDLMFAQGSFASACELLCDWHDAAQVPLRAASYMQRWFHDQLVCAVRS